MELMATLHELAARQSVCRACPRLVAWREEVALTRRRAFRDERYWGRPLTGMRRMVTVQLGIPNPRRTNRPLTALATRLTLIPEEGRTGRCPRVLTDER
jgi:hypothetical protein